MYKSEVIQNNRWVSWGPPVADTDKAAAATLAK